MGPTIIFDKSVLQSISVDESVFLQQFFITNMIPSFYVETLGDLDLGVHKSGKPIVNVISELAIKVPSVSIAPNMHHSRLILGNLLGQSVEMDGRTLRDGGVEKVDHEGHVGIYYDESSEEIALKRWHDKQFSEVERLFSRAWRASLSGISFDRVLGIIKNVVPPDIVLKQPSQIKEFVEKYVKTNQKELLFLVFELLGMPEKYYVTVLKRWEKNPDVSFEEFAPYAAYALKIELFFYISMLKGIEDKNRPSHKVDLSYLYYLPFCNVFVSSDRLHKRIAPMFLRENQVFVSGEDFKSGLAQFNDYYSQFADEIAEKGFMSFASQPPACLNNEVTAIWDKIFPRWRRSASKKPKVERDPEEQKKLVEHLNRVHKEAKEVKRQTPSDEVHHMVITHKVPVQKGKYRILPKGIEDKKIRNDS